MQLNTLASDCFSASIGLAHSGGYLSKLSAVYHYSASSKRPAEASALAAVMAALEIGDYEAAVRQMLDEQAFPDFPIPHPMATILRDFPDLVPSDPGAVAAIAEYTEGYLRLAGRGSSPVEAFKVLTALPKQASRQNNGFQQWVHSGMPEMASDGSVTRLPMHLKWSKDPGPWTIGAGDANRKRLAAERGIVRGLGKGLDLLALSAHGRIIAGEAKFMSDFGGAQDKSLRELITFVREGQGRRIAVIDGVLWPALAQASHPDSELLQEIQKAVAEGCTFVSALLVPRLLWDL